MIEVNYLVRNKQTGEEVLRGNGKFESTEYASPLYMVEGTVNKKVWRISIVV